MGIKYREHSFFLGGIVKTIVVSDVHLGSEKCDKAAFNAFLSSLHEDAEATDLVLLGDLVDMWRRDASGVFLENMDTVEIIKGLQHRLRVHYVVGNHDYHLRKLKNRASHYHYPFEFKQTLELTDGDHTYQFVHGHEFEYGNELKYMEPIMEILCHVMSDSEGVEEDALWPYLARKIGDLQYSILGHPLEKEGLTTKVKSLKDGPEVRIRDKLEGIERRAFNQSSAKPGQLLIFGHTHHPFIDSGEKLVNAGSWVTDASPHNTYIELKAGRPRLFVFQGSEIMDRQKIA
jgi:UDP-2,3-diacylglucosamine pyrophosphatase LpxH